MKIGDKVRFKPELNITIFGDGPFTIDRIMIRRLAGGREVIGNIECRENTGSFPVEWLLPVIENAPYSGPCGKQNV